jgi:hypothetical protein
MRAMPSIIPGAEPDQDYRWPDGSEVSLSADLRRRPQSSQERAFQVAGDDTHFCERSAEKRREGEALIREADNLACQSWNEKMWSDGGPIDPSPTIDQATNGGHPWLEIKCSCCQTPRNVDLAALPHVPTTCVHDLAGRLVCQKCKRAEKRPAATLLQLAPRQRLQSPD